MRRSGLALVAGVLGVAALIPFRVVAAEAGSLPEGVWAASASGAGTSVLVDTQATGGAIYVANATAPFAETTVTSAPSSEAVGSYAYDKNAASGVYSVVSAQLQANGMDPLPPLPNTAFSRYPTGGSSVACLGLAPRVPCVATDHTAGPLKVGAAYAKAATDEGVATSEVRSATSDLSGPAAFTTAEQEASASSRAVDGGVRADATARVLGISVAGGLLTIDEVRGGSRTSTIDEVNDAETTFQVLGASVNGTPVTIGADGVTVAGRPDTTTPGALASIDQRLNEQLAAAGIRVSLLAPVTYEKDGASASTPGLAISIVVAPPEQSLPAETVALVLGRTAANTSLTPVVVPELPVIAPNPGLPPTVTTVTIPGGSSVPRQLPEAVAARAFRSIPRLPPVVMLFVLWQVWTLGWVALAWWRREIARSRA